MSQPTPRQVLYALVAGGFLLVVAVLTTGGAVSGIAPAWWTIVMAVLLVAAGVWTALNWRRTAVVLLIAIGLFLVWMVGTLVTS